MKRRLQGQLQGLGSVIGTGNSCVTADQTLPWNSPLAPAQVSLSAIGQSAAPKFLDTCKTCLAGWAERPAEFRETSDVPGSRQHQAQSFCDPYCFRSLQDPETSTQRHGRQRVIGVIQLFGARAYIYIYISWLQGESLFPSSLLFPMSPPHVVRCANEVKEGASASTREPGVPFAATSIPTALPSRRQRPR